MLGWVAGEGRDVNADTVMHTHDTELGDGVLLEEFGYELLQICEHEHVTAWTEVFLVHRHRYIEDEDEMADDASLERCGILQKSL